MRGVCIPGTHAEDAGNSQAGSLRQPWKRVVGTTVADSGYSLSRQRWARGGFLETYRGCSMPHGHIFKISLASRASWCVLFRPGQETMADRTLSLS